jgi:hypothetical protein
VTRKGLCLSVKLIGYRAKLSRDLRGGLGKLSHLRFGHVKEHHGVTHPSWQINHATSLKVLPHLLFVEFPLKGRTFGNIEPDQHSVTLPNSTVMITPGDISHDHSRQ